MLEAAMFTTRLGHGLSQLQYALPRLVTQYIEWNLGMLPEENVPFFFCPILLTTSEILVAADGLTMNDVEHADTLADFASPVPYVVVYADETRNSRDIERRHVRHFLNQ